MTQVFVQYDETTGKEFRIHYDTADIVQQLKGYIEDGTLDEDGDCDEYPINNNDEYGYVVTEKERQADLEDMKNMIDFIENAEDGDTGRFLLEGFLGELIDAQPKKKNGSFAKNRVNDANVFYSFGVYWEDHYGRNTPAIRVRSYDDYDCKLLVESYIIKN